MPTLKQHFRGYVWRFLQLPSWLIGLTLVFCVFILVMGFLLVDGQTTGRPTIILASILLFAVLGKATDALLSLVGRRLLHWQDSYHALPH